MTRNLNQVDTEILESLKALRDYVENNVEQTGDKDLTWSLINELQHRIMSWHRGPPPV